MRVQGKNFLVPAADIGGYTVVVPPGRLRIAEIFDDVLAEGDLVSDPPAFLAALRQSALPADLVTFFQRPPDVNPRFPYHLDWDNYAVADTSNYDAWWEKLPQETRKNTRRAAKRGVTVRAVPFSDELVRGVHKICNEAPVRQGKPFWHYGKDFDEIKREHGTYVGRSEFIGAYFENELIGSIKMVYVGRLAVILHILAFNAHHDKRPLNALIAKAVEICSQKGMRYFVYGNYAYGNKKDSLMEFKRRNGFAQLNFPRYYVPLTLKGRVCIALRLYRGWGGLLPAPVLDLLLRLREKFYSAKNSDSARPEE